MVEIRILSATLQHEDCIAGHAGTMGRGDRGNHAMRAPKVNYRCPRDWRALPGNERRRFCDGCGETVHNLSAMEPHEAEQFVEQNADACIRFRTDATGRLAFRSLALVVLAVTPSLPGCSSLDDAEEVIAPEEFDANAQGCPVNPPQQSEVERAPGLKAAPRTVATTPKQRRQHRQSRRGSTRGGETMGR